MDNSKIPPKPMGKGTDDLDEADSFENQAGATTPTTPTRNHKWLPIIGDSSPIPTSMRTQNAEHICFDEPLSPMENTSATNILGDNNLQNLLSMGSPEPVQTEEEKCITELTEIRIELERIWLDIKSKEEKLENERKLAQEGAEGDVEPDCDSQEDNLCEMKWDVLKKLELVNKTIMEIKNSEVSRLRAVLRIKQIATESLKHKIKIKEYENVELKKICDELAQTLLDNS